MANRGANNCWNGKSNISSSSSAILPPLARDIDYISRNQLDDGMRHKIPPHWKGWKEGKGKEEDV